MESIGGYYIGYCVLAGLWITPLSILWFISLCLARRKQDPARVGVAWMKATYPIWNLALGLNLIWSALRIWLYYGEDIYMYTSFSRRSLDRAISHISVMGSFFQHLADILLFVTFVELGSGFLLCQNGGQPTPIRRSNRIAILVWGAVLLVLSIALMGVNHSTIGRSYDASSSAESDNAISDIVSLIRLEGAVTILMWLTSIPVLAFASYVVHKTKNNYALRSSAVLLLVATILDFIRLIISMAINAAVYLGNPARYVVYGTDVDPAVIFVVEPFFNFVFMFVILVLLFCLGIRKSRGLWSSPQSGWNLPMPVAFLPPGQGVPMAAPQQMPMPMPMPMQQPTMQGAQGTQGLPAYLQYHQQQQQQQPQPQPQQVPQGYYYYPQPQQQLPPQQPAPVYQQQQGGAQQQQFNEPKAVAGAQTESVPAPGQQH
ncbi:hypothetical protein C8A03DRAFT_15175 [Achaetomium macrosporum]|uniref:Uncharacterized protein n=1 Tax=Achaetomium macrosporum TaxID=79813 RepID=A0AAN7HFJ6_9PEZI|nr:hypothetical protein C8A03DRAFT_15175 [Achaetomium macrosporum]